MKFLQIELILGPVRAGKSDETIRRILEFTRALKVFVCKSYKDTRDPEDAYDCQIRSRTGARYPAVRIGPGDLSASLVSGYDVVVIDEAFMLEDELTRFLEELLTLEKPPYVLLASLEYSSEGNRFACIEKVLDKAWKITHLRARCEGCGAPAVRSKYVGQAPKLEEVQAGGDECYIPVCLTCA